MGLSRKHLWRNSCLIKRIFMSYIWETDMVLENVILIETLPTWTKRDRERVEMKQVYWIPQILTAGNTLIKLLSCKHMLTFLKMEGWLPKHGAEKSRKNIWAIDYSLPGLKPNGVCVVGYQTCLNLWLHSSSIFSLLNGNFCNWYPMTVLGE